MFIGFPVTIFRLSPLMFLHTVLSQFFHRATIHLLSMFSLVCACDILLRPNNPLRWFIFSSQAFKSNEHDCITYFHFASTNQSPRWCHTMSPDSIEFLRQSETHLRGMYFPTTDHMIRIEPNRFPQSSRRSKSITTPRVLFFMPPLLKHPRIVTGKLHATQMCF